MRLCKVKPTEKIASCNTQSNHKLEQLTENHINNTVICKNYIHLKKRGII